MGLGLECTWSIAVDWSILLLCILLFLSVQCCAYAWHMLSKSVCLSRLEIASKRLNLSQFFNYLIARHFSFLELIGDSYKVTPNMRLNNLSPYWAVHLIQLKMWNMDCGRCFMNLASCHLWLTAQHHQACDIRAVPDFGSGSCRNPALFPNPAEVRLQQKSHRSRIVLPDLKSRFFPYTR